MKRDYKKPVIKIVIFGDDLLQGEVIHQGSPTDDFSKKNNFEIEEENENFSNSVWSTY